MGFNEVSGKCTCEKPKCHRMWFARKRGKDGVFIKPAQCIYCKNYAWDKKSG